MKTKLDLDTLLNSGKITKAEYQRLQSFIFIHNGSFAAHPLSLLFADVLMLVFTVGLKALKTVMKKKALPANASP